ncbi:PAAR domain-containing protein [Paraburkholderia rhizosphaerae]|uniref:PAAR motif-containing protein n=1 Tax=Paraburkholderia rhizosphaerae TaxID=480658 RepID=A0A4R8LN38_9BURK|nr:PAAR domain-containing protein [Paraburkholderia rhizosphaerae]TDY45050.1 PAAR motif-containing protein [Paraburkholderia rhizosphaerae]
MRKAAIRNGDPTTTGGFVIAHSSTIHDNNEKIALSGDEATCGNCKGAHKIFGTGKGMSEGTRDVVIDGDRVLCPCGRNRVMVGINPGVWIDVYQSDSRPDSLSASSPFDQRDAGSSKREQHACWFYVLDSITGEPGNWRCIAGKSHGRG